MKYPSIITIIKINSLPLSRFWLLTKHWCWLLLEQETGFEVPHKVCISRRNLSVTLRIVILYHLTANGNKKYNFQRKPFLTCSHSLTWQVKIWQHFLKLWTSNVIYDPGSLDLIQISPCSVFHALQIRSVVFHHNSK